VECRHRTGHSNVLILSVKKSSQGSRQIQKNQIGFIVLKRLSFFLFFILSICIHAQSVGLLSTSQQTEPGYTLLAPLRSRMTYLIDQTGKEVHNWLSSAYPGLSVYLLPTGNLLRTLSVNNGDHFWVGGRGGAVELLDWDSRRLWYYRYANAHTQLHHDIEWMPNGNILMIAWEAKSVDQALRAGRNPDLLSEDGLWPDKIIEVQPTSSDSGKIVWQWHVWDHLIQDLDSTRLNFGKISAHPELLDLNFVKTNHHTSADWLHTNSIAYNSTLDQILISSRHTDEIYIIDHSTTTAEAATHSGGRYGHGGDILYRWGNPAVYRAGTSVNHTLFEQHDAHWIAQGLPGAGHLLIFNNGNPGSGGQYSSIDEIALPLNPDGSYSFTGTYFGPEKASWSYTAEIPHDFYAKIMSGAQRLSNGNTIFCNAATGLIQEVSASKNIVWSYMNPIGNQGPLIQGEEPLGSGNALFRVYKFSADYSGLTDHWLISGSALEFDPPPYDQPVVDSGQHRYYNNSTVISPAQAEIDFPGQDAAVQGFEHRYRDFQNGMVKDLNTGLFWQQAEDSGYWGISAGYFERGQSKARSGKEAA